MSLKKLLIIFLIISGLIVVFIFFTVDETVKAKTLDKIEKFKKTYDAHNWKSKEVTRVKILDFFDEYIEYSVKALRAKGMLKKNLLNPNDQEKIYEDFVVKIKDIKKIAYNNLSLSDSDIEKIMDYIIFQTSGYLEYSIKNKPDDKTLGRINRTWVELVVPELQYTLFEIKNREELRQKQSEGSPKIEFVKKKKIKPVPETLVPVNETKYVKKKVFTSIPFDRLDKYLDKIVRIELLNGKSFNGKIRRIEGNVFVIDIVMDNGVMTMRMKKAEIRTFKEIKEITEIVTGDN